MPALARRLRALGNLRPIVRSEALVDALRHAAPDEVSAIAGSLLEIASVEGYMALIERYYQIDAELRARICQGDAKLSAALVRTARSRSLETRRSALQIIEVRRDTKCLSAIASQFEIESNSTEILEIAARSLLAITREVADSVGFGDKNADLFEQLDRAVAIAVDRYPAHRQADILLAAALLEQKAGPALAKFFGDDDHPSHFAIRGVLKNFDDASVAGSALDWLSHDRLAGQMLDRLASISRSPNLAEVLRDVQLVHLPSVRNRLRRLNSRYPCSVSSEIAVREFNAEQQVDLISWLQAIKMRLPDRVQSFGDALMFRSATARLSALRALIAMNEPEADAMVESFCFDEEESIARIATRHCVRRRGADTSSLLERLLKSGHLSVRSLAVENQGIAHVDRLWDVWEEIRANSAGGAEELEDPRSLRLRGTLISRFCLAVRSFLVNRRDEFIMSVRRRLLNHDREPKESALQLVRMFNLTAGVELELLALAADSDSRLTSTVMILFGEIRSEASLAAILAGLQHPNSRVRSNAVEALQHRNDIRAEDYRASVRPYISSDENRLRANAAKAIGMIDTEESDRQITIMLKDPRPMHRVSALWVAERVGRLGCTREVANLAKNDDFELVRKRARRTASRLLGQLAAKKLAQNGVISVEAAADSPDSSPLPQKVWSTGATVVRSAGVMIALGVISVASGVRALAQGSGGGANIKGRLSQISDSFVSGNKSTGLSSFDWTWLAWLAGVVGLAVVVAFVIRSQKSDVQRRGPEYRELAARFGLNPIQIHLLNRIARRAGLRNGLGLLISEGTFDHWTSTYWVGSRWRSKLLWGALGAQVADMRCRLFGFTGS